MQIDTKDGELARSKRRRRAVLLTATASVLAKIISISTGLISVPLTLEYLGPERYGVWITIVSLMSLLAFADLGLGNGLMNLVATANGSENNALIQRYVSSGTVTLAVVAAVFLGTVVLAFELTTADTTFVGTFQNGNSEIQTTVLVMILILAVNIPLGVVSRVQMGLQQGFLVSLWQCLGSILGLIAVLIAIAHRATLPTLALSAYGGALLATIVNNLVFYSSKKQYRPTFCAVKWLNSKEIFRAGWLFLILQILASITYASDNIIIARVLGAASVTEYSVVEKMFSVIGLLLAMLLAPLWPAYGEAIARGDGAWVKRTLYRSIAISLCISTLLSLLLVSLSGVILTMWVGPNFQASFSLIVGFGVWKVVESIAISLSAFLNGANIILPQILIASCTGLAALTLKFYLLEKYSVAAIPWIMCFCFIVFAGIPYAIILKKLVAAKIS